MKNLLAILFFGTLCASVIGSCNNTSNQTNYSSPSSNSSYTSSYSSPPKNDYQDMRNRGHSEEDAVIFSILKQQGYSDYEAIQGVQSSKE